MDKFGKLFEPGKIGKLQLKNRYVMPAMVTGNANYEGQITDYHINYYTERARGGVGLIIVEVCKPEYQLESWSPYSILRIDTMKHNPGYIKLTDSVHLNGAKIALQITAGEGSWIVPKELWIPGFQSIGPTTFAFPGSVAHALTTAEVEQLVQSYGAGALRAKLAGFDAIEIHGHSSYVLGQFMSPYVNTRTDKYGELWRLPVELLQSAKSQAGDDFTVIFRISGDEFVEGGRTVEGTIEICKHMEEAGVDAIDVSDGTYYTAEGNVVFPYMTLPRGTFVPEAEKIKKALKVPIIVPGRLSNPYDAEKVLEEGKADFIGVGRGLIADPELPKKVAEGRLEDIRPCISCNECIGNCVKLGRSIGCTMNAQAGMERDYKILPAEKPKNVLIIGGGPGGMEAARVAAQRGHKVTLYEKADKLGGRLIEATVAEHKQDIRVALEWLVTQAKKSGANIVLNKEVTPEMVTKMKPDVVIVAVGGKQLIPEIPGIEKPITVMALDVLLDKVKVGDEVIVEGGGAVGCDVAAYLADQGKKVTIVARSDIASDVEMHGGSRGQLLVTLEKKGITWLTYTKLEEVTDEGVIATDRNDGTKKTIKGDTVVLALGFEPITDLYEALKDKVPELYAVGDCVEPRKIWDAIHEGFFSAFTI
jgi:2,4-dienoyl-CoA reductase-like NADH-dependent reductase (Old Yellow Enzyme family)/thioredoxin reductase